MNRIDHIAVGADSLEQGVTMLKSLLGCTIPDGGKHDQMSTHNCLAQAGPQQFIELIAIDPDAPPAPRTRWFTLDNPETQARLALRPRALCWVVNTPDLDSQVRQSPVDLGEILTLTRGDRRWRLTVPPDGSLLESGLIPAFIEWPAGVHPSESMQDLGITLRSINLGHPEPDYLTDILEKLSIAHLASVYQNEVRSLSFSITSNANANSGNDIVID